MYSLRHVQSVIEKLSKTLIMKYSDNIWMQWIESASIVWMQQGCSRFRLITGKSSLTLTFYIVNFGCS